MLAKCWQFYKSKNPNRSYSCALSLCMHNQFLWKGREIHNATTAWYSRYHGVVLSIPRCGTHNTTAWYSQYHGVVLAVPRRNDFLVLSTRKRKIMLTQVWLLWWDKNIQSKAYYNNAKFSIIYDFCNLFENITPLFKIIIVLLQVYLPILYI